jgi:sugar phosphate isomerase/epimerase
LFVIVSASTECFPDLPIPEAAERLLFLEYSSLEIHLDEERDVLKPSSVLENLTAAIAICNNTKRLNLVAYSVNINATGDLYYEQFAACCKLAKATKVVTITVPSSELGTPFNEEVERLNELVRIAEIEGVRVAMKSQLGSISEDPDTVGVLCDNAKGLGLTLDPSVYTCGPHRNKDTAKLIPYVYHVHLRDTSPTKFQVQIGQGEIDYGKLINQLEAENYRHAMSAHISEMDDIDHAGELRKMRLLLESLV